jgi:hypothetical protein
MGTGPGSTGNTGSTAQAQRESPYTPPELVLPPDGPYGPDPHGRKGPQQGSRTRKVAGIVAISAMIAAGLAQLALGVLHDDGTGTPSGPPRTVTLPRSLDDGKLTLTRDFSDEPGLALHSESHETAVRDLDPVAGRYESRSKGEGAQDGHLIVRGYNGTTIRPASTIHDLLTTLEGDEASAGERKQIRPPGADVRFTCEVMLKDTDSAGSAGVAEVPVCAWADNSSYGAVLERPPGDGTFRSDLDAFAKRVNSLRSEVSVTGTQPGS